MANAWRSVPLGISFSKREQNCFEAQPTQLPERPRSLKFILASTKEQGSLKFYLQLPVTKHKQPTNTSTKQHLLLHRLRLAQWTHASWQTLAGSGPKPSFYLSQMPSAHGEYKVSCVGSLFEGEPFPQKRKQGRHWATGLYFLPLNTQPDRQANEPIATVELGARANE